MWDSEMILLLRHIIDDLEEEPKYSDDRLRQLLLVSAQFVNGENSLAEEYVVSVENQTLKPDPTNPLSRDDSFINLVVLKAACLLARGGMLKAAKQGGINAVQGPYRLDTRGKIEGQNVVVKTWCDAYSEAQRENTFNGYVAGMAIVGPYRSAMTRYRDCRSHR